MIENDLIDCMLHLMITKNMQLIIKETQQLARSNTGTYKNDNRWYMMSWISFVKRHFLMLPRLLPLMREEGLELEKHKTYNQ